MMSGKWHNGSVEHQRPMSLGFQRYWGLLSGCSNYFNPGLRRSREADPAHKTPGNMRPWGNENTVIYPFAPLDTSFHSTDAINDRAIDFMDEWAGDEDPFFLYLSHCAPHGRMRAILPSAYLQGSGHTTDGV